MVSALLLGVLGFGYGAIPALGPVLDPGSGAWTSASGGKPVSSQRLHVPGLTGPVTVSYTGQGLASISAGSSHDVFLALGYVHAKFRLSELDAERRLGEGRLAQLAGPSDLPSDEFELRLGLLRTARNEWARTTGASRTALIAYAQGVNDDIAEVRASGGWPALFSLTGQYPRDWTPVDSLVVQGVLTQELDYTTGPLDMALIDKSLGSARTAGWFPATAANTQTPYDPGPYAKLPLTPLAPDAASSVPLAVTTGAGTRGGGCRRGGRRLRLADGGHPGGQRGRGRGYRNPFRGLRGGGGGGERARTAQPAASDADPPLSRLQRVGRERARGRRRLRWPTARAARRRPAPAADAALGLVRGSSLSAPGYQAAGVSVPGMPGVLLGHNKNIAWSLTDTQNSATFYYAERVRGSRYPPRTAASSPRSRSGPGRTGCASSRSRAGIRSATPATSADLEPGWNRSAEVAR